MELEALLQRLTTEALELTSAQSQAQCQKCNDTGWIYHEDDNGFLWQTECDCGILERKRIDTRIRFASIPVKYKDTSLSDIRMDAYQRQDSKQFAQVAMTCVMKYLDRFDEMKAAGKGLYLYSETKGSGKTMMMAAIANELMHKHRTAVRFSTSLQILDEIKRTWEAKEESEHKLLDALATAPVLVIDDFGTERAKDWINDKFYQIINGRYISKKITMFTANMDINNLSYDDRITNRIKEMCYMIPFPNESVREHMAAGSMSELLRR